MHFSFVNLCTPRWWIKTTLKKGRAPDSWGFRFVLVCWFSNGIPCPVDSVVAFLLMLQLHPMYRLTLHGGCCCTVCMLVSLFSPVSLRAYGSRKRALTQDSICGTLRLLAHFYNMQASWLLLLYCASPVQLPTPDATPMRQQPGLPKTTMSRLLPL